MNLFIKIYRLIKLSRQNSNTRSGNYYIVETSEDRDAFSFFNYMFISPQLAARQTVIDHELIHIRQKHSWDIIYTELLKIISWFNPVVYLLQHRVKELHEFIADNATVGGSQNTSAYTDFLVNNAYGVGDYSLVNTFFSKSLLKQRIIMLHQKRSGRSARLKYLVSLPVVAGLLCVSTLAFSKSYGWINVFANKKAASSANKRLLINSAVDKLSNVIDPKTINTAQFEQIIADFKQQGILMGYKYSKDENKKELLEISLKSLPGLGWKSNSGASATFRMDELLQGDYIILAGADTSSESLFVRTEKRVDSQSVDTNRIPPPPPPRAPRVTNVRFPAPNPPSSVTKKGYKYAESGFMVNGKTDFRVIIVEKDGSQKEYFKNVATPGEIKILNDKYGYIFPAKLAHPKMPPPPPPPAAGDIDKRPPPPPPAPPGDVDGLKNQPPPMEPFKPLSDNFSNLGSYLAKTVRYPAVAINKEITGSVIISFSVDGTNGIDNIIVEKGIGYRCDEEVVRALKSYKATLKTNPGSYKIAVTYSINGLTPPKPASAELGSDPQFIGEVSVMGYPGK